MNRFTISSDFIRKCSKDNNLFLNVLIPFIQDNEFKVCLDNKKLILNSYEVYANTRHGEWIRLFISNLTKSNHVEVIHIKKTTAPINESFFINFANLVPPERQLIVDSKQKYYSKYEQLITTQGVKILDGEEAKGILCSKSITYNETLGDNSPITIGDKNKFNIK